MERPVLYLQTIFKLGLYNVAYVIWYRFTLISGIRKYFFPTRNFSLNEALYLQCRPRTDYPASWENKILTYADNILSGELKFYSYHLIKTRTPPDWFHNYFNNTSYRNARLHWTKLSDFSDAGDIKNIWELSRLDWVVTLARAYSISGRYDYLETLNQWLNDWKVKNPLNIGPNWKCGQEASVRIFNLINTSLVLEQEFMPSKVLCDLVYAHLERINTNILYAIAQDNNHGTSEAAALFIGGNWLLSSGFDYPKASRFAQKGRYWIENRMDKLVEEDGSFSQHSVTYHRLLLDTLIFVEFWRQKFGISAFNKKFYKKGEALIEWLSAMTDNISGNCPNLGANDGALFLNLHSCDYRDFRPSLQTAAVIFLTKRRFDEGIWDEPLYWFGRLSDGRVENSKSKMANVFAGGVVILRSTVSWCLIRFPHYRFRPAHNDVFHFDLWYKGRNIIHDAGSYSYHPAITEKVFDFKSVHAHNTVSFDDQEQMPAIGRFLLGGWIEPDEIGPIVDESEEGFSWQGTYTDARGNIHRRKVKNKENIWIIEDHLSGNFKVATIGFNLFPENYSIRDCTIKATWGEIRFTPGTSFVIIDSCSSDYYMEKHMIKRVKITIDKPQIFITTILLKQ